MHAARFLMHNFGADPKAVAEVGVTLFVVHVACLAL